MAEVCQKILHDAMAAYDYTCKNNLVAIVTDGSAVLGLGNIGARAALPVMEGKAVLFKTFGGVEAFPICISTQETDLVIRLVEAIAPAFGGINLEDISSPRCFEIESTLCDRLDIPVFHDDQHGTAVVALAGLLNALKIVDRKLADVKIVFNGAGASAICGGQDPAPGRGPKHRGLRHQGGGLPGPRPGHELHQAGAGGNHQPGPAAGQPGRRPARARKSSSGSRGPTCSPGEMVGSMAADPIVFALANPDPEIHPEEAKAAGAAVVATGRSDFPNQVNNCLAFPGIFRGALDIRARAINDAMNMAAAHAIADLVGDKLEPRLHPAGRHGLPGAPSGGGGRGPGRLETGSARIHIDPEWVGRHTREFIYDERLSIIS